MIMMKMTKTYRLLILLAASVLLVCSCRGEKPEDIKPDFALYARVQSLDYNGTSIWGTDADLGVFVTEPGTITELDENFNIQYSTKFQTYATLMTPADKAITLPEKGKPSDIYVYYPFNPSLHSNGSSKTIYSVDLKDQTNKEPALLLCGKETGCNTTINAATVNLKPVYSKLNVRLKNEYTTKSTLEDIRLNLTNMPWEAEIDVMTGEYVSYGKSDSSEMIRPLDNVYVYEAILLAHKTSADAKLVVTFPKATDIEQKEIKISEIINSFETNCQYDIEVSVTPDGIKAILVSMSDFSVSDWHEDQDDVHGNIKY